jgi:hypothetical protein
MSEFKIDEELVENSLACVNDFINILKIKEDNLKKIKFNNRIIYFKKSSFEFEQKLIGSLGKEYLMFEELNFSKFKNVKLLEHDNFGQKALFNADDDKNINIDLLDSKGKRVKQVKNIIKTSGYLAVKSSNYYILNTYLDEYSISILGNPISRIKDDKEILVLIDNEFNYLKHKCIGFSAAHIVCNDSTIIFIDFDDHFHFYDMDLRINKLLSFITISWILLNFFPFA